MDKEELPDVKVLVNRLMDGANMTPAEISEALGGRVSMRTIYRWAKGQSEPQNLTDVEALASLTQERCPAA